MSPSFLQSGLGFEYETSAGIDASSCSVWVEELWSAIGEVTDAMLFSVAKNLARSDGVCRLSMMVITLVSSARAPVSSVSCASWAGDSFSRADIWKGTQKRLYIYNRDHCQCCGKELWISYVYVERSPTMLRHSKLQYVTYLIEIWIEWRELMQSGVGTERAIVDSYPCATVCIWGTGDTWNAEKPTVSKPVSSFLSCWLAWKQNLSSDGDGRNIRSTSAGYNKMLDWGEQAQYIRKHFLVCCLSNLG